MENCHYTALPLPKMPSKFLCGRTNREGRPWTSVLSVVECQRCIEKLTERGLLPIPPATHDYYGRKE